MYCSMFSSSVITGAMGRTLYSPTQTKDADNEIMLNVYSDEDVLLLSGIFARKMAR